MRRRKQRSGVMILTLLAAISLGLVGCNPASPKQTTQSQESYPNKDQKPQDGVIMKGPKLSSLELDDGTQLQFDANTSTYTVSIPAGRPRIPKISASSNEKDAQVTIYQAMFPDEVNETYGKVDICLNGERNSYYVNFKKDASLGFVLQYGDRYDFTPAYQLAADESFTFQSSNEAAVKVNTKGQIQTVSCTNEPVTVSALVNGEVKDTLIVQRIDRAQINIFLIVGQSNAEGTYDGGTDWNAEAQKSTRPQVGTAWCMDVDANGNQSAVYDLCNGRRGFAPALAAQWYALTGEKSLSIQSAVGGSPIECWEKGGDGYYGSSNLYDNTLNAYRQLKRKFSAKDSSYEIIRVGYFWCQGETAQYNTWMSDSDTWMMPGNYIMPAEVYYEKFMTNHRNFVKDMDVEFASIALVRALSVVCARSSQKQQLLTDLVPVRAAQYTLHNTTDLSIAIRSRVGDIARTASAPDKESPGYAYTGSENLHYTQTGYNAQGKELANNTFAALSATIDRQAKELEVIASDGRTRLSDGALVTADREDGYQLAAMVLPIYTDQPYLSYEVTEGAELCTVDLYGKVQFTSAAKEGDRVTVKVTAECGISKSVILEIGQIDPGAIQGETVTFTWEFDDLNEKDGKSALTLSPNSPAANYYFADGKIIKTDSNTDFVLETPFVLTDSADWSIEWRGKQYDNSCLFGTSASNHNFIYLAYNVPPFGNPFRMVSNTGQVAHIPYGSYRMKNTELNTWRVEYLASNQTMTLCFWSAEKDEWETVGSYRWEDEYEFYLTNLFGRYGDPNVLVCYSGEMDYITVTAIVES